MPAVASFELARYPWRWVPGRGRPKEATFARRLGTGSGSRFTIGADLRRWATFAVWDDETALDAHLAAGRWQAHADEAWAVRLRPLGWHGTWGGVDPLDGAAASDTDGPVAVLTRATIPLRHTIAFHRSVPPVDRWLHDQPGLLAAVGIGERPVGRQATFSLWRDESSMRGFAYGQSPHAEVVRRTREDGWFREELFARFEPYDSTGTWDGRDPLARTSDGTIGSSIP